MAQVYLKDIWLRKIFINTVKIPSLFQGRVIVQVSTNSFPDHGVLAHKNLGSSTQRLADLLHLFGSHIIYTNKKHLWILIHVLLLRKKRNDIFSFSSIQDLKQKTRKNKLTSPSTALQAATILVAMASEKKIWRLKFRRKTTNRL